MSSFEKEINFRLWMLAVLAIAAVGCDSSAPVSGGKVVDRLANIQPATAESVVKFCGDCHVPPDPLTYPKGHWGQEVQRGFDFYEKSGRDDLFPPSQEAVLKYYLSLAPEQLTVAAPVEDLMTGPVTFRRQAISDIDGRRKPGVSHILADDDGFYACDMLSGGVSRVSFDASRNPQVELLASVKSATHVERVDLLDEGVAGLLVSDIGDITPEDHQLGGVYFFPASTLGAEARLDDSDPPVLSLLESVGRVADAKAVDLDKDGAMEVVVAIFGYHETGSLELLRRSSETGKFRRSTIDGRHGASHVLFDDLDSDGDPDLIVLHSQEFESVTAYLNDGQANFEPVVLFTGPVPDYGCSSIRIADLDADGDTDIVLTNGDSMDSHLPKPHHGIRWLENRSRKKSEQDTGRESVELRFVEHLISSMVGCYGADVGDLDGDGDLDIVSCAMIWDGSTVNSVVWFEQQDDRTFIRHCLDVCEDQHPCIELGDYDQDGDLDIAVGEFEQFIDLETWTSVWWNEGRKATSLEQDRLTQHGE
jgi:hypothetical protein